MKRLLSTLTLLLCFAFTAVNAQDNYNATTMGEKVYLETANWGQNSPFNKQIFTSYGGSTNAKAGCVPTAYAIVMRYHGFPTEGTAKTLYNCQAPTYVEITDRVYDFSKMPLTNGSNWTEEEQAETSKFFSHVLHACFPSKIGTGATEVNEGQTSKVLNDYFNYQLINASYQANFTMEQWIEKIKESIDNGCPIPYASDNSGTGDTRHMFVLDGYTANNYFHFNFGWNGSGNGWFKLDAITPSQGDNYSWIDGAEHYALFNLAPNKTMRTVTATANDSNMGTVSINGGTVGITASAEINEDFTATLTAHPAQGYALANWTKNGVVVGTKNTLKVKVGASDNDYVANFDDEANVLVEKDCTFNISSVEISGANGSYCSTWTTSDGIVLSCSKGSEPAYALSTTVNTFFAKAPVGNSETLVSDITYTLTAPAGYIIKSYNFKGKSPSSSYTIDVTVGGNTTNVTNASAGVVISASDINAQSTSFVLSSTYAGRAGLSIMEGGVTVTIVSEGADVGGGSTPTPDPEPEPTPTTYAVTTTANPADGGTAKFSVGTGSQKTEGDVNNGEQITLYATANTGYNFVNWTLGGNVVSTDATCNVNVAQASNYVANFEAEAAEPEYPEPTGATYQNNYLTSVTTTGANENISYTADTHPGNKVVTLPGTVRVEQGKSFTLNLVAKSLSSSTSSVYEDMRYCHASLFTDFDGDRTFGAAVQTWGSKKPSNNVAGNYSSVMNITHEITVPAEAPLGTSHVRMIYTNAWTDWPTDGTAVLDKGIVYDIVVEVVEPSNERTLNVTFNNATYTKTDGTELTSGWGYQVVTQTTPAVTIKVAETINNFGYTTGVISGVKTPYLYKNTNFILSISEQYKITGYKITVRGQDNSYSGDFTCSVDGNETSKATLSGTTTQTLSATGLDTNIINISVGGTSGNGIFITALEITYVENEFEPLPFQAEIEGWRNNNPNTHLGTITIGGTPMKLTPEHLTASELTMPLAEGTTLAFTRKYRGFEFNGFYIGATSLGTNPTLTADNVAAINETTPLLAKFTATDDVTLFYDDDEFSYRIPAIANTGTNRLVAVSDYRHSHDDIGRDNHKTGTLRVDLVMRTSDDNGATWSAKQTIAEGNQNFGYGDAAVVANGQNILVMAVAGNVFFTNATSSNKQRTYRIYSADNGVTWEKEEVSSNLYTLFPNANGMFFGSGKLVVDPNFNNSGNARVYGAVLLNDGNNYVVYSDNWGSTWNILGGGAAASANEPKVEILPNGQILLSARRNGGRTFNVFTYTDKANNSGTWSTATNGCDNGGNGTNGEIICLDAKKPNGKPTKILLQSQPYGSDRRNVSIWYKEISANETYTASSIASGWTMGKQVSTQLSAYSAMCLQENGEIALFFEEAPCHNNDHTYGYSMVYVPLTIEEITGENFLNPNAVVETVTVDVTLTDAQGNIYTHQFDYLPGDAAAIDAALMTAYPFITELGEGNLQGSDTYYTYTNTVTLPFKVSNANTTVWHNIYFPANGTSAGEYYPIYLMAENENATAVAKITEKVHYGNSQYNTYNYADKLAWAVYNVNEGFTFKFKNKLTGKFMAVTGVSSDNTNNVVYTDEAGATAFTLEKYTGGNASYGNYAIKSVYNSTTGYVCNTSVGYTYATNYPGTGHAGAWAKIVESPDYWTIYEKLVSDINNFGTGNGKYTENDDINNIDIDALASMPLNSLNTKAEEVQNVKESYREVVLTVNDDETATVPGTVSITVNGSTAETVNNKFVPANATVSILATANPGYRFVNWTRPAAQASAAARTAEARNSDVVSDQNPYTVTVSEALSLEANFEQIVVDVTLTDAQSNEYNVQLSGFTTGITTATVAAKLTEKYPYITLGDNATLDNVAYTYSNKVTLPFKVSSVSDATSTYWHNIYYPSNNKAHSGYPNYIAAFDDEDDIVDMAESPNYAYGDNPTYNTKAGNNKISWAIYSANNSLEFIFKNELTNNYIKVESVVNATGNTKNVKFVDNAGDATAFTLLKDAGSYNGDYALVAKVEGTTGYLCATSSSTNYVTHFDRNDHQGAWVKFEEVDYGQYINVLDTKLRKFDVGDGKYMITDEIQAMINALVEDYGVNITKSQFEAYFDAIDAMDADNWPMISLTINPVEGGTTNINGEENVVRKYVPNGYELPLAAIPAEGYHFVSWTDGTSEVSTVANYTFNITAATELTANFAKNSYAVSVTAGEGGSASASAATVEHGNEVTLTATPSTGYSFAGWYDGENLISAEASYTFTVTSDINYTARFNEVPTGTVAIHITVASTDATTVTNSVDGNVKAIINNIGQEWAIDADFVVGADVELVATNDYNQKGYLFDGWYKSGVLVSNDLEITVKATETATYQARFFKGCTVTANSNNNRFGYISSITLADGTSIGYDASNRAVVRPGTEVKINTYIDMYGYEVSSWRNASDEVVGTDKDLIIEVNEDVTYTAIFEPVSYNLTVRANYDERGTVSATSGTSTGTTIKVGHNMEATITAVPAEGYRFVEWTKGTDVVNTNAIYTIAGIENVEDMLDAEYVAVFEVEESVNPNVGTYYRIGYDGFDAPAAASAARAAATTYTYAVNYGTGTSENVSSSRAQEWVYTNNTNEPTLTLSATFGDTPVHAINMGTNATANPKLYTHNLNSSTETPVKYTLAVSEDYIITNYSFEYYVYYSNYGFTINGASPATKTWLEFSSGDVNAQTAEFTISSTNNVSYMIVRNFTVTIQEVGSGEGEGEGTPETPEIPANRYYIQSVASNVAYKTNALLMTQETGAASIFYYADNKLMSYKTGTFVKENSDGARGLQAIGVENGGNVTITTNGNTSTIAVTSYMHANKTNDGSVKFVDHCGLTSSCNEHNFVLEEVTSLPVTISSAGYATWYAPVAVELPDAVTAYTITINGDYAVTGDGFKTVPAKTGVILAGAPGTYNLEIVTTNEVVESIMEGTVAAEYLENESAYVLSDKGSLGLGFYMAADGKASYSHKAYLPKSALAPAAQMRSGFRLMLPGVTAIEEVETENVETIYDLTGRKLEGISGAGIYIINGKKVIVR